MSFSHYKPTDDVRLTLLMKPNSLEEHYYIFMQVDYVLSSSCSIIIITVTIICINLIVDDCHDNQIYGNSNDSYHLNVVHVLYQWVYIADSQCPKFPSIYTCMLIWFLLCKHAVIVVFDCKKDLGISSQHYTDCHGKNNNIICSEVIITLAHGILGLIWPISIWSGTLATYSGTQLQWNKSLVLCCFSI
jgi:hypothetical protein